MLTREEALLMQAAYDEQDRQQAQNAAGLLGAGTGALAGSAVGAIPHSIGQLLGGKPKTAAAAMRPGFRMAGGLTGAILGGALGAGVAGVMKQESSAARLLGKIQAQGGQLDELDKMALSNELTNIYNNPSKMGM